MHPDRVPRELGRLIGKVQGLDLDMGAKEKDVHAFLVGQALRNLAEFEVVVRDGRIPRAITRPKPVLIDAPFPPALRSASITSNSAKVLNFVTVSNATVLNG